MSANNNTQTNTTDNFPLPEFIACGDINTEMVMPAGSTYFTLDGSGRHSKKVKHVGIEKFTVELMNDEDGVQKNEKWGSLCVWFDTETWNVEQDGLIYTDKAFLAETREFFAKNFKTLVGEFDVPTGFCLEYDIGYSEYGMQEDDYVHFDLTIRQLPITTTH